MPIVKVRGGYKVKSKTKRFLSREPMTYDQALKQLRAVKRSQREREGK
jgi:hypothetical protein